MHDSKSARSVFTNPFLPWERTVCTEEEVRKSQCLYLNVCSFVSFLENTKNDKARPFFPKNMEENQIFLVVLAKRLSVFINFGIVRRVACI